MTLELKLDNLTSLVEQLLAESNEEVASPSAWLGTTATAELLGVSASTLHRWRADGTGPPCSKMRGSLRYERAAVQAWLTTR